MRPLAIAQYVETFGEINTVAHAVSEITLPDGSKSIFDGTPRQFKWGGKAWSMDKAEYMASHAITEFLGGVGGQDRGDPVSVDKLYWGIVAQSALELVRALDWNALRYMETEHRESLVQKQADASFANAFELAEVTNAMLRCEVD